MVRTTFYRPAPARTSPKHHTHLKGGGLAVVFCLDCGLAKEGRKIDFRRLKGPYRCKSCTAKLREAKHRESRQKVNP